MRDEQRSASFGDYLQALAFRVLHEDRVLQPRRASLFETEQPGIEEYQEPAQIEIAELLRPALAPPPAMESSPRGIASPAPATPPPFPRIAQVDTPGLQPVEHPDSLPSPRNTQPPMGKGDGHGGQPLDIAPPPTVSRSTIEVIRTALARERVRVLPEPAPPTAAARLAGRPAATTPLSPPAPREATYEQRQSPDASKAPSHAGSPAPEIRQIVRERVLPAPLAPVRRRAEAPANQAVLMARVLPETRTLAPLFTPGPRQPQPETTVEITIGRLEIRAASTPAAATPKTPPRQPEVSLKEYLTRNAGGRS
jgi:hypothetical protein